MYYGKEQEKQVLKYLQTRDEKLYHKEIHGLLKKIAYGVATRMKMKPYSLYQSEAVKAGCVSLLWEKLVSNYDPDNGRSYSYLTAVAQNYYCSVWRVYHRKTRTLYKSSQEIERLWISNHNPSLYTNVRSQIGSIEEFRIREENKKERVDLALQIAKEIGLRRNGTYDAKVAKAIEILLSDPASIGAFNKKALYLYMREITGLNTKKIVHVLNKARKKYAQKI